MPCNGDAVILPTGTVTGLANYPRGRLAPTTSHRTLYVSGTSSRRPDGTFDSVETSSDGTQFLDVRKQTAAILRNIIRGGNQACHCKQRRPRKCH
ncbi:l-psp endoribonuclease family [Colletotrichum kahawae]|uniref:L-psp endoribonuclease family n=1 Tax=Colletotrichum kahawae TaxID=34407 RepID=A0AAD9Y6P6_COLKA|nr:l-psp endoribonuclease family [Colletotrichum kahawae]